ncbi:MAG: NAD(P)-binding domain-containing protein [Gammaproteobacteria bacterium]|nr:NAD(P)-binding domain-containing protein [Gammaproteobacteria bacterium]MDH5776922.1 NAD(P)-binding domain-containing protein [Gammaproteobacteria bacterium]
MDLDLQTIIFFSLPIVFIFIYALIKSSRHKQSVSSLKETQKAGIEPASLHPVTNPGKCIGCGACVTACPEGKILGLVHGKAQLINPSKCIGHGACKRACPFDAIELVFGTEKRGVDIPHVKENFETNVPGLFIAGELGGMGLIRNAVEQGRQAMEAIRKLKGIGKGTGLDVVIIGAGPAGLAATLGAKQHKLRAVTIEQDSLGGTVFNFPRGKIVMTAPVKMPLVGKISFRETTKEKLLKLWQKIEKDQSLKINYREKVEDIKPSANGFTVTTTKSIYETKAVLLCIGRRGTPRKLGVPGEELPKVVYNLIDPEQYKGQHVLIVGGGDSALEAATSIAEQPGSTVTISYRSGNFSRAKPKNQEKIDKMSRSGQIKLLLSSTVDHFSADKVVINCEDKKVEIANDAAIVCAGGILPTPFLKQIGIEVETKHGTA